MMLRSSTHGFKVNFCKFTNETRLAIEEASQESGQTYIAALNGLASGGGYELALACEEIFLVDDRRSAVALPEIPFLGVLPGTGGLTRLVDKRLIQRDHADVFVTLAEGLKGRRAAKWNFVDGVFPSSSFKDSVEGRAQEVANGGHPERKGVALPPLNPQVSEDGVAYQYVKMDFGPVDRSVSLSLNIPEDAGAMPSDPSELGGDWFPLQLFRELDDALLRLRFNLPDVGLMVLNVQGALESVQKMDASLNEHRGHWFVNEVILLMRRTLKRLELSAKSIFALIDEGSCFGGSMLELALAADRSYMLDEEGVSLALTEMNWGLLRGSNGLTRLETRFLGNKGRLETLRPLREAMEAEEAEEQGLVTFAFDDLDWEDEIRLAIEERVSMSPDALTGSEASLRFAGPETLETKIFGRLSAWQNWIFQRPNAVGPQGALTLYGRPERAEFDFRRT